MIEAAGIESSSTQLLINAINPIFSLIAAVYGATLLDKLGRRVMLMAGLVGALGSYILLTAFFLIYTFFFFSSFLCSVWSVPMTGVSRC